MKKMSNTGWLISEALNTVSTMVFVLSILIIIVGISKGETGYGILWFLIGVLLIILVQIPRVIIDLLREIAGNNQKEE